MNLSFTIDLNVSTKSGFSLAILDNSSFVAPDSKALEKFAIILALSFSFISVSVIWFDNSFDLTTCASCTGVSGAFGASVVSFSQSTLYQVLFS